MSVSISHTDIADLCTGSVFLATGGGGDPYVSQILVQQSLKKYGAVDLVPLDDVPDDAYVVAIGEVGAPTVSLEQLPHRVSRCRRPIRGLGWTQDYAPRFFRSRRREFRHPADYFGSKEDSVD
jgi:DUF917 family protein